MSLVKGIDQELARAYTDASLSYDETRFHPVLEEFMISALLKLLGVREGMHILDVAAGTGRTAIPFAQTGATVIAIDLTPAMIARMRAKATLLDSGNLHTQQANARHLPFPDHTFDVVVSLRFFHLFPLDDQTSLLREMHRVVRPGGQVLVEYNNARSFWVGGFIPDALRCLHGKRPLSRVSHSQLQTLYKDYDIVRLQGFSWPFVGAITRISPRVGKLLLEFSMRDEFAKYARFVWAASVKPDLGRATITVDNHTTGKRRAYMTSG